MLSKLKVYYFCLTVLLLSPCLSAEPLFDTHIHYNAADAEYYNPQQIIQMLDQNEVRQAAVTSIPIYLAKRLYQQAPDRIVPLLGVYRDHDDKVRWSYDTSLPVRIEAELKKGGWRGIGELHLFAKDRHSPVFRRIIKLADQYKLPLLMHADPAVIDRVYDIAPEQPVIWAHAGTFPYPDLVADYLQRYPALSVDLSVRDDRIAPNGEIHDDWYELFISYPERIMIGIDTYSLSRWHDYTRLAEKIRQWLNQLPEDIASRLAYKNAAAIFQSEASDGLADVWSARKD